MIPQRDLRNDVAAVLRRVEGGESLAVSVRGRVVARLVPASGRGATTSRERFVAALHGSLGEAGAASLSDDIRSAVDDTIDQL